MKILVTGGTGVIGAGAIPALLAAGHEVRLLSRGARRDSKEYPENVDAFPADVADPSTLRGAAEDCDAIVHITGIVDETPPEITYQRINVDGTRNMLAEAERAGVERFIFLSSLGADTGRSGYHQSKRAAERLVRDSKLHWLILRPGNVYGPGDEVISLLLKMVRALPAVPLVGDGEQQFQPIWFRDLGLAIARACDDVPTNQIYELAGAERTTTREVIHQLCDLTARNPAQLALPVWLAQAGVKLVEAFGGSAKRAASNLGLAVPLNAAKLDMLLERNVTNDGERALGNIFGVTPTPLRIGLASLVDELPELLLEEGVGGLHRKRFWARIKDAQSSAEELMRLFKDRITVLMPIEFAAEPGAVSQARFGDTLTGTIPGRGNIQVRVEEENSHSVTLATVTGHPLAGVVAFRADDVDDGVIFTIEVHSRAANVFDWIAMNTLGTVLQNQNWKQLIARVIELSGGHAPDGVESSSETLSEEEAARAEKWARNLIRERKREENQALSSNE